MSGRRSCEISNSAAETWRSRGLLVTVRDRKTGFRVANTMPGAVADYERIRRRYPSVGGEDCILLPDYPNRATAARTIQRPFNRAMERTGLKHNPMTNTDRTRERVAPT
jgi:hypothetical protein